MKLVRLIGSLTLLSLLAIAPRMVEAQSHAATLSNDDDYHHGEDPAVTRGRAAFHQRDLGKLGGNGRSCADCHMPFQGFQLSPAAAKSRYDFLQWLRQYIVAR